MRDHLTYLNDYTFFYLFKSINNTLVIDALGPCAARWQKSVLILILPSIFAVNWLTEEFFLRDPSLRAEQELLMG
jgi:hypothetical protein